MDDQAIQALRDNGWKTAADEIESLRTSLALERQESQRLKAKLWDLMEDIFGELFEELQHRISNLSPLLNVERMSNVFVNLQLGIRYSISEDSRVLYRN